MTDSTQALRQCAAQLNRAKTKAAELEHASRAGWAKVTELDEENKRLRATNLDCVDHFNVVKAERDELLTALKWIASRCPATLMDQPLHTTHKEMAHDSGACARAAIAKAEAA